MKVNKFYEAFICFLGLIGVCAFIIAFIIYSGRASSNAEVEHDSRIEIIEESAISGSYYNYVILVDRDTDVTYLLVQDSHGIGITEIRDSGGMVKLRD